MKEFYVWCADRGESRGDAVLIGASTVEEAAELWVERFEQRSAEYSVAGGGEMAVVVLAEGDAYGEAVVDVEGVPRPTYLGKVRQT